MRIYDGRRQFYQWDLNQQLTAEGLAAGDEIHFANATSTHALVVKAYEAPDGTVVADVPNALLREAYPIMAYRYITQGDSEHTVETTTFSVQKRPQPSDYIYSETEVLSFEQLIEQVKDALKKLEGFEVGTQVKVGGEVVQTFDADTKLGKVTTGGTCVYGINNNGEQVMWPFHYSNKAYTLAYRVGNGELPVGRAVADTSAVPLQQMKEALAEKANGETTRVWLEILTKKVTNLEDGTAADAFIVDDATAYVKDIPSDAASYAELLAVGGMTHKVPVLSDENLFVSDALNDEWDGNLYLPAGDSVEVRFGQFYHYNEVSPALPTSAFFPNAQVGKTHLFSYKSGHPQEQMMLYGVTAGEPFTMTEEILNGYITFRGQEADENGEHVDGYFYDISLVEVTDVLLDTPVTALEITGKNLFDEKAITGSVDGNGVVRNEISVTDEYISVKYGSYGNSFYLTPFLFYVKEGQQVNVSADVFIPTGGAPTLGVTLGIGNPLLGFKGSNLYPTVSAYDKWERVSKTLTANQTGYYFLLLQGAGNASQYSNMDVRFKNIKVTTDTNDTTYSPYHKTTFAIPAAVQALDGYGWGIPNGAVNGIEWNEGGAAYYVKRVGRVVYDGTEAWWGATSDGEYYSAVGVTDAKGTILTVSHNVKSGNPKEVGAPCAYFSKQTLVIFPGDYASTVEEWKAQLAAWAAEGNPLTVYYELAEPIVTNVTRLFDWDNLIAVEGGGTITAVNEHNLAAPSTIVYRKRGF